MIASLSSARCRREERLFVAEGIRCLSELLPAFRPRHIVATSEWLESHSGALDMLLGGKTPDSLLLVARNDEMERMSSIATPQGVLAVFAMPVRPDGVPQVGETELVIALDRIQDPGNLGTIIRVADWFGVKTILASRETVDAFNPKVLQSTMGALARVNVCYCDLVAALRDVTAKGVPVYGTFLDGGNIYAADLSRGGVVVMGNEGNGISPEVADAITNRIKIPSYPAGCDTVESLNVAAATAVTVAEFRRQESCRQS